MIYSTLAISFDINDLVIASFSYYFCKYLFSLPFIGVLILYPSSLLEERINISAALVSFGNKYLALTGFPCGNTPAQTPLGLGPFLLSYFMEKGTITT